MNFFLLKFGWQDQFNHQVMADDDSIAYAWFTFVFINMKLVIYYLVAKNSDIQKGTLTPFVVQ